MTTYLLELKRSGAEQPHIQYLDAPECDGRDLPDCLVAYVRDRLKHGWTVGEVWLCPHTAVTPDGIQSPPPRTLVAWVYPSTVVPSSIPLQGPAEYTVCVGNIGIVYNGESYVDARQSYDQYVRLCKDGYGMGAVADEHVVMFRDGRSVAGYHPCAPNPQRDVLGQEATD